MCIYRRVRVLFLSGKENDEDEEKDDQNGEHFDDQPTIRGDRTKVLQ